MVIDILFIILRESSLRMGTHLFYPGVRSANSISSVMYRIVSLAVCDIKVYVTDFSELCVRYC